MNKVKIDKVKPNEWNPNIQDEETHKELKESIKQANYLEKNPILVRPKDHNGFYQIIDGEQRWKVAKELDFEEVPVKVEEMGDFEAQRRTVILNKARGKMDYFRLGRIFTSYEDKMTQEEIGEKFGGYSQEEVSYIINVWKRLKEFDNIDISILSNYDKTKIAQVQNKTFRKILLKARIEEEVSASSLNKLPSLLNDLYNHIKKKSIDSVEDEEEDIIEAIEEKYFEEGELEEDTIELLKKKKSSMVKEIDKVVEDLRKEERKKYIKELYEKDLTPSKIAEKIGTKRQKVVQVLETLIINEWIKGKELEEISKKLEFSKQRVSQRVKDFKKGVVDKWGNGKTKSEIYEWVEDKYGIEVSKEEKELIREILHKKVKFGTYVDKKKIIEGDFFKEYKELPEESVDLIVVDPPYNISKEKKTTKKKGEIVELDLAEWDKKDKKQFDEFMKKSLKIFKKLLKPNGSFYIFTDKFYISHLIDMIRELDMIPKNIVTWRKSNPVPSRRKRNYLSATEFIVWGVKGKDYTFNFSSDEKMHNIIECPIVTSDRFEHPTQKPVEVIKKFIEVSSSEGDLVLDPFAGTGTTAIASRKLDRNWLMMEKESEYVKIIKERING